MTLCNWIVQLSTSALVCGLGRACLTTLLLCLTHNHTHSPRDSKSASWANAYSLKHTFPINTSNPLFIVHTHTHTQNNPHRVPKGWGKCRCFDSLSESDQSSPLTKRSFFFQCVYFVQLLWRGCLRPHFSDYMCVCVCEASLGMPAVHSNVVVVFELPAVCQHTQSLVFRDFRCMLTTVLHHSVKTCML